MAEMSPMVPKTSRAQFDDYVVAPVGLPDGRIATIAPLLFGQAMLTVASPENHSWGQWDEGWTYPSHEQAIYALIVWDGRGDPLVGWVRHQPSNRRRPEGDPTREEVRP